MVLLGNVKQKFLSNISQSISQPVFRSMLVFTLGFTVREQQCLVPWFAGLSANATHDSICILTARCNAQSLPVCLFILHKLHNARLLFLAELPGCALVGNFGSYTL